MNTQSNPKTIHQVPGPCASIMKLAPNPTPPLTQFHAQLAQAKTKAEALELMIGRGSTVGWWSDLPEGLWDKLQGWKTRKQ